MEWFTDNWFLILLLLGCIVIHFFMHGGHGKSADNDDKHRH